MRRQRSINFRRVAEAAAERSEEILQRWLPDGRREIGEWSARNPRRADGHRGSFKVNLKSGLWADFATGDSGRDLIALAAYLFGLKQDEAARRFADMLGIDPLD
jgi:hypothetical protein